MITLEQARGLHARDTVHVNGCSRLVGPRGGVVEKVHTYRVNGVLKEWKRRPGEWELPIVAGLKGYGKLNDANAGMWHVAGECPLLRTKGAVKGLGGA